MLFWELLRLQNARAHSNTELLSCILSNDTRGYKCNIEHENRNTVAIRVQVSYSEAEAIFNQDSLEALSLVIIVGTELRLPL